MPMIRVKFKRGFRIAAVIMLGAALCACAFPAIAQPMSARHDIGESNFIAPPRFIKPSTETVDLRNAAGLEFRWSPHEGDATMREYYDLRLYKGTQAFEKNLIYKTRISPRVWSVTIPADMFENGSIYICTLRQVYLGPKSRRTFLLFKVVK